MGWRKVLSWDVDMEAGDSILDEGKGYWEIVDTTYGLNIYLYRDDKGEPIEEIDAPDGSGKLRAVGADDGGDIMLQAPSGRIYYSSPDRAGFVIREAFREL